MKKVIILSAIFILSAITARAQNWLTTGNAGLSTSNFIGTTDAIALAFKVNNKTAGKIDYLASKANLSFGYQSLNALTTGKANTGIGFQPLFSNTVGNFNTGIGTYALRQNSNGNNNTAVGYVASYFNTTGYSNVALGAGALYLNKEINNQVAVGDSALYTNTVGEGNTAVGSKALFANWRGSSNTAIGFRTLFSNTIGVDNVANGAFALYANTEGYYNVAIGSSALSSNKLGYENTATGVASLATNTIGNSNTAYGARSLQNNTTGYGNVAMGSNALYSNTTSPGLVAVGDSALFNNTDGRANVAIGTKALYATTVGGYNTATGTLALYSNTTGSDNTANGESALFLNTSGYSNTAIGSAALIYNSNGANNSAVGSSALYANTSGYANSASGYGALNQNTTGSYNTGHGYFALSILTNGNFNTSLGAFADVSSSASFSNAMALGSYASTNASNKVVIGDNFITVIGGKVGWSTLSDGRFKKDIKQNVPGLSFINKLNPVTYHLEIEKYEKFLGRKDSLLRVWKKDIASGEQKIHTGLIAQEVEKTAKEIGYDFDGVNAPQNEKDNYSIVYADFVPSLIKAVQELSKQNDELRTRLDKLEQLVSAGTNNMQSNATAVTLSSASLQQNKPNPFSSNTVISYYLPADVKAAMLTITASNGTVVKNISLTTKGNGSITLNAGTLAAGTYIYSLMADGKMTDNKQMVVTR